MCINNRNVSIVLLGKSGNLCRINPDCQQWTCKECGPKKRAARIAEVSSILRWNKSLWFYSEALSGSRATYFKIYHAGGNYLRMTVDGIRYWISDKKFSGSVSLHSDDAVDFALATIGKMTTAGQHLSYSDGWRVKPESQKSRYRRIASGCRLDRFLEASDKHTLQVKKYVAAITTSKPLDVRQFLKDANPSKLECNTIRECIEFIYPRSCCTQEVEIDETIAIGGPFRECPYIFNSEDEGLEWSTRGTIPIGGLKLRI